MAIQSLKATETDTLKIYMLQHVLTVEILAEKCGVSVVTMRNQIAKNFPSLRLRLVVEDVLKSPIWTAIPDFEIRQQLSSWCGFDPFVLSVPQIRRKVSQLKIRGRSKISRKSILIGFLSEAFRNRQNQSPDQKI